MKLVALRTAEGAVAWWEDSAHCKGIRSWPMVDGKEVSEPDWGRDTPGTAALAYAALLMATEGDEQLATVWTGAFVEVIARWEPAPRIELDKGFVLDWLIGECVKYLSSRGQLDGWAEPM